MFFFYESFYKLDTNFEIAWLGTRFFGTKSRSSSVCCKTGISWRKIYVTKIEQWPKFSWRSKRMYKIHVLKWFWNTCWIHVIRFISLKNNRPFKVCLHWRSSNSESIHIGIVYLGTVKLVYWPGVGKGPALSGPVSGLRI